MIEGFDELSTFEEQYNAAYYQKLIENCGYEKEVDWTESKLYLPEEGEETLQKMTDFVMKRYNLHFGEAKNVSDFIDRYGDEFFALLDKGYENLYGTVPFTQGMKDQLITSFKLIVDLKHLNNYFVADVYYVFNFFGAFNVKVADVNHDLFAGCNFNECAKIHNSCNNAFIDCADFRIVCDSFNHEQRTLSVVNIKSADEDASVFFNVNFTVAFFTDLLYNLALLADNIADL